MGKSVNVLMRNLYDPSPETRGRAAMDLGEMGAIEAVDSLAKVLQNDDQASVRAVCAEALGTIAEPKSIPELVKALEDEKDDSVKFAIDWALKAIAKKIGKTKEEAIKEYTNVRTGIIDRNA
jgi:HEAT repeat protein